MFDIVGRSEIGQKLLKDFFSPFLNKGLTIAIVNASGKHSIQKRCIHYYS